MRIIMIVTLFMLSILGVSASGHAAEFGESSATINNPCTGLGPFTNCLKIMEPDGDIVYFAPHVGEVKKEYSGQSGWELKEVFNSPRRTVVLPLAD
jgi:hypothetical protein